MFDYILDEGWFERFFSFLSGRGFVDIRPFSKGTTSLIFRALMHKKDVIIKLQRPDSPRNNLRKEAAILKFIEPFDVTPPLVEYGTFEGLDYIVKFFAPGDLVMYADIEKRHLFQIVEKTAFLDRLGLDHGQIQGGKHIIIGDPVYLIDFEKAGWRKPKNLTSAMAMMFLNENVISKRLRRKFGIDDGFLTRMTEELRVYKRTGKVSGILHLLSAL